MIGDGARPFRDASYFATACAGFAGFLADFFTFFFAGFFASSDAGPILSGFSLARRLTGMGLPALR
ncbi:MAG: hypothetical protein KDH09_12865, partial [Chrysiogenetes bacterium]|nr:hypothetical protein [Chrysiogenetes bacterium]